MSGYGSLTKTCLVIVLARLCFLLAVMVIMLMPFFRLIVWEKPPFLSVKTVWPLIIRLASASVRPVTFKEVWSVVKSVRGLFIINSGGEMILLTR